MSKSKEFDTEITFDAFEKTLNAKEQSSLAQVLDLIPDTPDGEQEPDQQLARYDGLVQESLSSEFAKDEEGDDLSLSADDIYRRELAKIPPLSPEQEAAIVRRAKAGDASAKTLLVEHNLRLVSFLVKYWLHYGCDYEDLRQEGNLGLMEAAERYDYEKGFKFSTYAVWWIRKMITAYISRQGHTLPVPPMGHRDIGLIKKAVELYSEQHCDRPPTVLEISKLTGVSQERIRNLMGASTSPLSIDMPNPLKEGSTLQDVIPDSRETYPDPAKAAEAESLYEIVKQAMQDEFTPKERHIMELRFGFVDGRKYTLQQIGSEFGVSRQRMNIIEKKAIAKLKDSPYWKTLCDFAAGL